MPRLLERLAHFPGLKLRVVPLPRDFPTPELEAGELDLVIGAFDLAPGDAAPRGLKRQVLVKEKFLLVGRAKHPALRRPVPDIEALRAAPPISGMEGFLGFR